MTPSQEIIINSRALDCLSSCEEVYNGATLETDGAHVLLEDLPDCTRVTFRGSKSIEDWVNDAEFGKIMVPGGMVHEGIWTSYRSIKGDLIVRLNKSKPLEITGHSLGGGQAVDFAYDVASDYSILRVVTFGQPRVGDGAFCLSYDKVLGSKTLRFVDCDDIVPRLPFRSLGFSHVGTEAFISSSGDLEINPAFWLLLTSDVENAVRDISSGALSALSSHHLSFYRSRLEAIVNSSF